MRLQYLLSRLVSIYIANSDNKRSNYAIPMLQVVVPPLQVFENVSGDNITKVFIPVGSASLRMWDHEQKMDEYNLIAMINDGQSN